MIYQIPILLAILTGSPDSDSYLKGEDDIPLIRSIDKGLPASLTAPKEGYFLTLKGVELLDGTFLPVPTNNEVLRFISACSRYPELMRDYVKLKKKQLNLECEKDKLILRKNLTADREIRRQVNVKTNLFDWIPWIVGFGLFLGGTALGGIIVYQFTS